MNIPSWDFKDTKYLDKMLKIYECLKGLNSKNIKEISQELVNIHIEDSDRKSIIIIGNIISSLMRYKKGMIDVIVNFLSYLSKNNETRILSKKLIKKSMPTYSDFIGDSMSCWGTKYLRCLLENNMISIDELESIFKQVMNSSISEDELFSFYIWFLDYIKNQ